MHIRCGLTLADEWTARALRGRLQPSARPRAAVRPLAARAARGDYASIRAVAHGERLAPRYPDALPPRRLAVAPGLESMAT